MSDVHGLLPDDLERVLEMLPPFADLTKEGRVTYLKVAAALHNARDEGYFIRIKTEAPNFNKVAAIKAYRTWSHLGLKEAKDFVESGQKIGPLTYDAAQEVMAIFSDLDVGTEAELI